MCILHCNFVFLLLSIKIFLKGGKKGIKIEKKRFSSEIKYIIALE